MKRAGRPRKLSPDAEAAIIGWYAAYQRALNELRRIGSVHKQALKYGVSVSTISSIPDRAREKERRYFKDKST